MIEQLIYTELSTDAGLMAIIGSRVYPVVLPQAATFPALTYQVVSDVPEADMDEGDSVLRNLRVQINCWSEGYAECKTLSQLVMGVMKDAITFASVRSSGRDQFDSTKHLHYSMMDFSVWTVQQPE